MTTADLQKIREALKSCSGDHYDGQSFDGDLVEEALGALDKLIAEPLAWLDDEKVMEEVAKVICDKWGYIWDGDADCDEQVAPDVDEYMDERPSKQLYRVAAKAAISCIKSLATIAKANADEQQGEG